jgi:hypothetical protein
MIVGPILNRSGGYCFDIWTAAKGVSLGYTYRRIEDAYYDRKLTLEASGRAPLTAIACETADAFQNEVKRALAGPAPAVQVGVMRSFSSGECHELFKRS